MLSPNDSTCQEFPANSGFATRASNFAEVASLAEEFSGIAGLTWHALTDILFDGFRYLHISEGAHHLLLQLCRRLHTQKWAIGDAVVWPSNESLAELCVVSTRTIQARLRELEAAGLIIREYTRINSRMTRSSSRFQSAQGGIDLAPLGARLSSLRQAIDEDKRMNAMEREARHNRVFDQRENSCRDENSFGHKQSHLNYHSDTVPTDAKAPVESAATRRFSRSFNHEASTLNSSSSTKDPNCSPGGEGTDSQDNSDLSIAAETARSALIAAIRLSPVLSALPLLIGFVDLPIEPLLSRLGDAVAAIFPERNTLSTWDWAVKRHGWRAGLCLIAALEDPTVRDRYRMFGYLATKIPVGELDLTTNFRRIEKRRETDLAVPEAVDQNPTVDAPIWQTILDILQIDLGAATVKSWFLTLNFASVDEEALSLIAPSKFHREYVIREFERRVVWAARRAGHPITRLEISVAS